MSALRGPGPSTKADLPLRLWTGVCAAWLILTWAWRDLHLAMTVDDTFYYFKTALNLARGLGSTFDGVNPTNGYHPLWLVMLAAIFSFLRDDLVFLARIAFTVQIAMIWAGGVILSRVREAGGTLVLLPLTLVMLNPFTAKIVLCGQETALQFLASSGALVYWWRACAPSSDGAPSYRRWAVLGALCALATLSRLDTLFFCGVLLAMPVVLPSGAERAAGLPARMRASATGFAVMGAGLAPYLAFNALHYGHLMPVSGAIKMNLEAGEIAAPSARLAAALLAIGGLAWLWLAARGPSRTDHGAAPTEKPTLALLAPVIGACLITGLYNFGVRGEMSPSLIRVWYLEPYLLATAVVAGTLLQARELPRLARWTATRGLGVLWLVFSVFTWRYRLEPRSYSIYAAAARCSEWFDRNTPAHAVAAAWDAGFAASMTRKPVMNLDGLINSWEFKERYLDLNKVDDFILARHPVDYVIQYAWPSTLRAIAARNQQRAAASAPTAGAMGGGPGRWGVDLSAFSVAHVDCVMVSVAYRPSVTQGPVQYMVLSRAASPGRPTLAEFAASHALRASCD